MTFIIDWALNPQESCLQALTGTFLQHWRQRVPAGWSFSNFRIQEGFAEFLGRPTRPLGIFITRPELEALLTQIGYAQKNVARCSASELYPPGRRLRNIEAPKLGTGR